MKPGVRPLVAVLTISIVLMQVDSRADTVDSYGAISRFTDAYQQAFQTGNPFLLAPFDPQFRVFGPLVETEWFDYVQDTRVELRHIELSKVPNSKEVILSFEKIQEDLQYSGMFTRGLSRVEMRVLVDGENVRVLGHRILPPDGATEGYRPGDPRSWGAEHASVERHLFLGLENLRDGDMKGAMDEVRASIVLVENGELPDLLFGHSYFVGMCYYVQAMIEFKNGYFEKTDASLSTALGIHAKFPLALNLQARLRFSEAEYEGAAALWKESLEISPDQWAVAALLETLDEAISSSSKRRKDLLLGLIDLTPSQAIQLLAPDVRKRPRDVFTASLLARAYVQGRDPEKALEVLEHTKNIDKDPEITYLAARVHLLLKDEEKSLGLFETLWELKPGYRDSLVFLVELYGSMGAYEDALLYLSSAPEQPSHTGEYEAMLARYSLQSGRFLDAVEHLNRATFERLPARIRAQVAKLQMHMNSDRR